MNASKLFDSSVWIDFLLYGNHKELVKKTEMPMLSVISLFEIEKKLLQKKLGGTPLAKSMSFIKKRSFIIPIDEATAEKAARVSLQFGLPAIDALIYSTAVENNAALVTMDNDFRGLPNVILLEH